MVPLVQCVGRRLTLRKSGRVRLILGVTAIAACALFPHTSAAQSAGRGPQLDLNRTERTFDALQREKRRAGSADVPLPQAKTPVGAADTRPMFKLTAVAIEGARRVPAVELEPVYRPYIGKTVSQADLAAIAGRISDLYRHQGYHLSRAIIPPQDIKSGRVRIQVIEGRIADIVVKGERAEQFGIRRVLAPVAAEQPSRQQTLERQLLLVNDLPGVRIADTSIDEIGTGTGRFRLILELETWQNFTAVSLDNRGTPDVGPLQSYVSSSFNSTFTGGDTLGVNLSTVPDDPRELGFGRLLYNLPVGIDGARIGVAASHSEVRPGGERRNADTLDRAQTYELRGSLVPIRSRDTSLWLSAAASFGEFSEKDNSGTVYRDRLPTLNVTADYQTHDRLDGWNYWTMTVRQGLDVLGASEKGDPLLSRTDGSGTFTKLELYYTRYQKLSDIWSLKMSMAGQLASTPLLASQEFYLGSAFGRGFFGSDVSGDNAIAGSIELRFDQIVKNDILKGYQLYAFADRTVAWNFHGDGEALSLSLLGAGARFYLANDLQAGIEVAGPVEYDVPGDPSRDPRAFFYIAKTFKLCPGSVQMRCS